MSLKKPPSGPPAGGRMAGTLPAHPGILTIPKQEEDDDDDWQVEFLRSVTGRPAAAATTARPMAADLNETTKNNAITTNLTKSVWGEDFSELFSSGSALNTPTMEYDESPGFLVPAGRKPVPQASFSTSNREAATADFSAVGADSLMEVVVPMSEGPLFQFPATNTKFEGIFDLWAFTGSPENIEHHAPLRLVEGRTTKPEKEKPALYSKPVADFVPLRHNYQQTAVPETAASSEQFVSCVKEEDDEDESQPGMLLEDQENPLLQWIIDDTIQPDSEFPLSPFEAEELQPATIVLPQAPLTVTINSADWNSMDTASQLFSQHTTVAETDEDLRLPPVKRSRRGRPPVPLERLIAPPLPRVRKAQLESDDSELDNLTEQQRAEWRYRRSRDLNNVASKRCRENRKLRQMGMEEEAELLIQRNAELKQRLRALEARVRRMKEFYLNHMLPGGGIVDPASLEKMWSP